MPLPITSVTSAAATVLAPAAGNTGQSTGFQDLLEKAVQRVESMKQAADQSIERVLSGEGEELHTAVLATERASMAFDLFIQVRNKVTSAYQQIMQMQV
jgi:flagellar hook-basal body complex protein FliE